MNKTELVAAVAEKTALKKKDAAAAIEAVFGVIGDALQKKEKVQLIGFGTFQTSERNKRGSFTHIRIQDRYHQYRTYIWA